MDKERLKLLVVVARRGQGDAVARAIARTGNRMNLLSLAEGTAKSGILEYLGLTDRKRDALMCTVRESDAQAILALLKSEFRMDLPGHGVAFTVPVHSVAGNRTYRALGSWEDEV